jgi:hypothetical protein
MQLAKIITEATLISVIIRFFVNLFVLFILIRLIYFRYTKKEEYVFSFFLVGIIIFLIVSLLETVDLKMGMALGLFAVFGILRFRTINFSSKDMTYFFTVIGISIVNSQAHIPPPVIGAVVINSIILLAAFILEITLKKTILTSYIINFKKPELLLPTARTELLKELSVHTGHNIEKVVIRKFDITKGNAELEVFFKDNTLS